MKTKNFKTKLHLICDTNKYRPVLNNVYFTKGLAVATNAHILITQSLEKHGFEQEEIEAMEGYGVHYKNFAEIYKYDIVNFKDGEFICYKGDKKIIVEAQKITGFLKFTNVLPNLNNKKIIYPSNFNINTFLLSKIKDVLFETEAQFTFYEGNQLLCKSLGYSYEEEQFLIMLINADD